MRRWIMTMVRQNFLLRPHTVRAIVGCPAWGGKSETLRGLDYYTQCLVWFFVFIYELALAGNEENRNHDAESDTRGKRRATGW